MTSNKRELKIGHSYTAEEVLELTSDALASVTETAVVGIAINPTRNTRSAGALTPHLTTNGIPYHVADTVDDVSDTLSRLWATDDGSVMCLVSGEPGNSGTEVWGAGNQDRLTFAFRRTSGELYALEHMADLYLRATTSTVVSRLYSLPTVVKLIAELAERSATMQLATPDHGICTMVTFDGKVNRPAAVRDILTSMMGALRTDGNNTIISTDQLNHVFKSCSAYLGLGVDSPNIYTTILSNIETQLHEELPQDSQK